MMPRHEPRIRRSGALNDIDDSAIIIDPTADLNLGPITLYRWRHYHAGDNR
jgi:hypothetical protein